MRTTKEKKIRVFNGNSPLLSGELVSNKIALLPKKKRDLSFFLGLNGLLAGVTGFTGALVFQVWVHARAYPLSIGGKPAYALPSYFWVSFECAILLACIAMFTTFMIKTAGNTQVVNYENQEEVAEFFEIKSLEKVQQS